MFSQMVQLAPAHRRRGAPGVVSWLPSGKPFSVMAFTINGGKIVEINILADPARLGRLSLPAKTKTGDDEWIAARGGGAVINQSRNFASFASAFVCGRWRKPHLPSATSAGPSSRPASVNS